MSTARAQSPEPCPSTAVVHDVRLRREQKPDGTSHVVAEIDCERKGHPMNVEDCASCTRFVRVEAHEAGYVVLCYSRDGELQRP